MARWCFPRADQARWLNNCYEYRNDRHCRRCRDGNIDRGTQTCRVVAVDRPASFIAASKDIATVAHELALMAPRYPSLAIPVEVIFGRQDPILNYRAHGERLVAVLPNATLRLIEGGHMIPVTVTDQIVNWIRQAAERASADTRIV